MLSIPLTELVVFVLLAGLVGVLAAVFPARRAARMGVLGRSPPSEWRETRMDDIAHAQRV